MFLHHVIRLEIIHKLIEALKFSQWIEADHWSNKPIHDNQHPHPHYFPQNQHWTERVWRVSLVGKASLLLLNQFVLYSVKVNGSSSISPYKFILWSLSRLAKLCYNQLFKEIKIYYPSIAAKVTTEKEKRKAGSSWKTTCGCGW